MRKYRFYSDTSGNMKTRYLQVMIYVKMYLFFLYASKFNNYQRYCFIIVFINTEKIACENLYFFNQQGENRTIK